MKVYQKHIIFWFLYFCECYAVDVIIYPQANLISELLFYFTHTLYLFYSNVFILKLALKQKTKKVLIGILLFLLNVIVFFILRYVVRFVLIPTLNIPEDAPTDLKIHFAVGVTWVINFVVYALAYFYFQSSIQKQKDLLKATEEKAIKDKETAELENKALRAQINPHFLFNTLGYFYNEISDLHPRVGDGIAALSDIMRSAIRKPDKDGLIPLDEEINNIEQLISIYELRYNSNVYISFIQKGDSNGMRILPHILNTLVENGFKHGELHNAEHPLMITLNISEESIFFRINNKKRIGPKELSHGIGMTYIRTHLNSVYDGRYTLTIDDTELFYTASLNIIANNTLAAA
jgi:two-component system LytT family sensor kinase